MRSVLFLIMVTAILATESSTLIKQLRQKPHKQGEFADYFYGMLELQQNAKIAEVANVVKGILDKLLATQSNLDAIHAQQSAEFEQNINNLQNKLENEENDLNTLNHEIGDLSNDLASLTQSANFQQKQLIVLDTQLQSQADNRADENQAYKEALESNQQFLNAVHEIIHYLTESLLGESLIQRQKAIQIAKNTLGEKHPIYLMIQVTQTHDPETVKRVILKLEEIEEKINEKLQKLESQHTAQEESYNNMKGQLESSYGKLSADYKANVRNVENKNNDLLVSQRRAKEVRETIELDEATLLLLKQSQERELTTYNQKRGQILEEISVVQSAYDLLRSHAEGN